MSGLREQMTDAAIGSAGSKIVAVGTGMTGIGWLTTTTGIAFLGLLVTIAGAVIAWVYKHREDVRLREIRALEAQLLRARTDAFARRSARHAAVGAGEITDPGPDQ